MLYYWIFSSKSAATEYIILRCGIAALLSFVLCLYFGAKLIKRLQKHGISEDTGKTDSEKLAEMHKDKKNVPTMGGITIIAAIVLTTLVCANLYNGYVLMALFTTIWFGVLGFIDDYIKLTQKHSHGLSEVSKLIFQFGFGLILGLVLYFHLRGAESGTAITLPFLKGMTIYLGGFYVLFVTIFIVGMSNSVNLTDGLDGLAIGCTIIVALALVVVCYIAGRVDFSSYLNVPYVPGSGELCVFCAALVGAGMGFMWYNGFPAQMFMGDTGSLAIGGIFAIVAIIIKQELLLLIMGGVFVIEALSVVIQVSVFKLTKHRVFKCAPIHHHFQFKGYPETKIVSRMWIVSALFAISSLISLKF